MHTFTWLWGNIPVNTSKHDDSPHLHLKTRQRRRLSILLSTLLALACLGMPIIWKALHTYGSVDAFLHAVMVLGIEIIYLFLAQYLILEPDMDNLGWYGGLMNDPFQITDNHNRIILFVKSILLPGRLINTCLKDFTYLFGLESTTTIYHQGEE